jgi:hypothetical protein
MTSPKEFREFALECGKHAAETEDPRLRETLMQTARLWMETAQHLEKSFALEDHSPLMKRRTA